MTVHNNVKRDKKIITNVTEEEREWIKGIAQKTGYKTIANFTREILFQVCYILEETPAEQLEVIEFLPANKNNVD